MSTPIGPREDEPIEETLRPHLWRLRARLVTPPDEARVEADLDRLYRAAREHAHQVGADPEVVALPAAAGSGAPWTRVGQVAAALLLAVAVGAGLAGVTDGDAPGSGLATPPGDDAPQETATADGASGAEASDLEVAAPDGESAAPGGSDVTADPAEQSAVPGNVDADEDADAERGSSTAPGPDAGASDLPGAPGGSGSGVGDGGADAPAAPSGEGVAEQPVGDGPNGDPPGRDEPVGDAPAGDDSADDAPVEPPVGEEIIAAPDPGALDGFGGERPCPDGNDSDGCLPPDASPADDEATDEGPAPEQPESPSQPTTPTEE